MPTNRRRVMPFKSKKQAGMMFAKNPKMAKEWAGKTPDMKALPEQAKSGLKKSMTKKPPPFERG